MESENNHRRQDNESSEVKQTNGVCTYLWNFIVCA